MLVNFRVDNFLSFNEISTFTMTLGKSKLHQRNIIKRDPINLLKFAALYGANASGKSNFVDSIKFARKFIVDGIPNHPISGLYNRNHENNKYRDSSFEFELVISGKIYSYGFSINLNEARVSKEWLYDITDSETEIFTRSNELNINYDYMKFTEVDKNRLAVYAEDMLGDNNSLFLTVINKEKKALVSENGDRILNKLYDWFMNVLEVISPDDTTEEFGMTYHDEEYLNLLANYLKNSDTGINKVILEETSESLKGIPRVIEKSIRDKVRSDFEKSNKKHMRALMRTPESLYIFNNKDGEITTSELKFIHVDNNIKYTFSEESDGTIRLVELFSVLNNLKEKVFVIDELDRSLHPLLTHDFIKKFLSSDAIDQLIISTHEDRLLDLSLLRRDEIWFVSKDESGDSSLYSLEEYKERFDKNIMNAYLDGRYGAIPDIVNKFPEILVKNRVMEDD